MFGKQELHGHWNEFKLNGRKIENVPKNCYKNQQFALLDYKFLNIVHADEGKQLWNYFLGKLHLIVLNLNGLIDI